MVFGHILLEWQQSDLWESRVGLNPVSDLINRIIGLCFANHNVLLQRSCSWWRWWVSVFRIYRESHSQSHYRIFCFDLLSLLLLYFIFYIYSGKYCPARARAHFFSFPYPMGKYISKNILLKRLEDKDPFYGIPFSYLKLKTSRTCYAFLRKTASSLGV